MTDLLTVLVVLFAVMGALYRSGRDEQATSADESYLWYGTQEILRGQVPLRDFRSYEPGRYWFVAPFERRKPGIRSTRLATTVFLTIGLGGFTATMLADGQSVLACASLVVGAACWSHHPWKRFDQAALLLIAAACSWVLMDPTVTTWFAAGVVVGLATVVGANHGLYGVVALGFACLLSLQLRDAAFLKLATSVVPGFALGSSPLWVSMLFVRGFARSFFARRVRDTTRRGSTNLALPYPVPGVGPTHPSARHLAPRTVRLNSLLFSALPFASLCFVIWGAFADAADEHPVVVGTSIAALVSWHHVVSRADTEHLATVAPVHIAAALAALSLHVAAAIPLIVLLGLGALSIAIPRHNRVIRARQQGAFVKPALDICDGLWFARDDLDVLRQADELNLQSPPHEYWLAVPTTLWILPLCRRRSAVFDTYCVYPASHEAQAAMIEEIAARDPAVAFVGTRRLDGREDLTFSRTHPQVSKYIETSFIPVQDSAQSAIRILRRRTLTASTQ